VEPQIKEKLEKQEKQEAGKKKADEEMERPSWIPWVKISAIGGVHMVCSFFSIAFFVRFLTETQGVFLIWSALAGLGFFTTLILLTFFAQSVKALAPFVVLGALAPLGAFTNHLIPSPPIPLLVGIGILLLLVITGATRSNRILHNSLQIRFFPVAKPLMTRAVTGILIVISIVVYLTYFEWGSLDENTARRLSDEIVNSTDPVLKLWFTGVSVNQTTDEFLQAIAESQLRSTKPNLSNIGEGDEESFHTLPEPEKKKLVIERADKFKSTLEQATGPVAEGETVKTTVYRSAKKYIDDIAERANIVPYIGVAVALIVFTTLRSVSVLFHWIIELFAYAIFRLLIALGFAGIAVSRTQKEEIVI
jgi:hypothetical protein